MEQPWGPPVVATTRAAQETAQAIAAPVPCVPSLGFEIPSKRGAV